MQNLQSKRFVVRQSLVGKNQIIEVTFKNGKQSVPVVLRDKVVM